MLCPACSAEVPAQSAFCPKCGHRLSGAAADPAAQAPAGDAASTAAAGTTPAERLRGTPPAAAAAADPEQVLWSGSYSAKAMYGSWTVAGLLTIAAIVLAVMVDNTAARFAALVAIPVIWIVLALAFLARRLSIHYTVTNQRLMHQRGLMTRVSNRIAIIDVDDVSFEQGPFERMFGVGTIKILSTDVSDPSLVMRGIDDVQRVANLIDNARREERRKRAIYMETI